MPFTTDLNPKKSGMDLGDLLRMDEAMAKNKLYADAAKAKAMQKTSTPAADTILAKPVANDMLKSSADDVGTQFRFNNNQSE